MAALVPWSAMAARATCSTIGPGMGTALEAPCPISMSLGTHPPPLPGVTVTALDPHHIHYKVTHLTALYVWSHCCELDSSLLFSTTYKLSTQDSIYLLSRLHRCVLLFPSACLPQRSPAERLVSVWGVSTTPSHKLHSYHHYQSLLTIHCSAV